MGSSIDDTQGVHRLVRRLRSARGWSQQELANRASVSFSFVNQVEGGKATVRLDALNKLLAVLGYAMRAMPIASGGDSTGRTAIPVAEIAVEPEPEAPTRTRQKNDWACY